MFKKVLQFLKLPYNKDSSFTCHLYPEPFTFRIKSDNKISLIKRDFPLWTPDGLGYYRHYNEKEEKVNVYIPRFGCIKTFDSDLIYRMVAYIPSTKRIISLHQKDYNYLIVRKGFSEFPINVRLTKHGNLTLTDKEKEKRKLIAIFNSTHNTDGRKIMMQLLNKNINIYNNK